MRHIFKLVDMVVFAVPILVIHFCQFKPRWTKKGTSDNAVYFEDTTIGVERAVTVKSQMSECYDTMNCFASSMGADLTCVQNSFFFRASIANMDF